MPNFGAINDARINWADFIIPEPNEARWLMRDAFPRINHIKRVEPIKIVNAPPLWDPILAAVREIYEPVYCCIAGGAVRDYLLGEAPKDVDVFMHLGNRKINLEEFYEIAQELGWQHVDVVGNAEPYLKDVGNDEKPLTIAALRGRVKGVTVDLLLTNGKTGKEIVEGFDFHICEHWYDGEVHSTPLGKVDVQKRQWTPSRQLTDVTKKHFDRVNKRLGGKYKLNMGEPWYMQFKDKEKIK